MGTRTSASPRPVSVVKRTPQVPGIERARRTRAGHQSAVYGPLVSPDLVVLDTYMDGLRLLVVRTSESAVREPPRLSPREKEIARMIANGLPNKAIAAVLDISSWTVSTHLRRMFARYRVCTRAAMVARLVDEGLLR